MITTHGHSGVGVHFWRTILSQGAFSSVNTVMTRTASTRRSKLPPPARQQTNLNALRSYVAISLISANRSASACVLAPRSQAHPSSLAGEWMTCRHLQLHSLSFNSLERRGRGEASLQIKDYVKKKNHE